MIDDFGCGEIFFEALFPGHAEKTVHLTTYLRRHTQCRTLSVGDINGFDEALTGGKKIFDCAVFRPVCLDRFGITDFKIGGKFFPVDFRQVRHLVDVSHTVAIKPCGDLRSSKAGIPYCATKSFSLLRFFRPDIVCLSISKSEVYKTKVGICFGI